MSTELLHDWQSRQLDRLRQRANKRVGSSSNMTDVDPEREAHGNPMTVGSPQAQDRLEFMSSLSHALRTPLSNIFGYAELLAAGVRGPLTGSQRHDIRRIQANERHLVHLVNSVISFANWENEAVITLRDIAVRAAVGSVQAAVKPAATHKQVRNDTDLSAIDMTLRARAEPARLHAILLHLVLNAIKYSPVGGSVAVSARRVGDRVHIRVADAGIGIAAAETDTIFGPFARADHAYVAAQEGVGLGLYTCRKLARAMACEVTVASIVGLGSTFILSLPLARAPRANGPADDSAPTGPGGGHRHRARPNGIVRAPQAARMDKQYSPERPTGDTPRAGRPASAR